MVEVAQEGVEHVAQAGRRRAHAVGNVEPSSRCLDRLGSGSVFEFFDGVIDFGVERLLLVDHRVGDVVAEAPADAAVLARFDEAVLGAGIKRIATLDERRMQHDVALLRRGCF